MLMDQQNSLPGSNLNTNQYDFIINPQKPKNSLFNKKQQLLLFIAGGALLIVVFVLLLSSVLGGGSDIKTSYATLQKQQAEIIRITTQGESKLRDFEASKFNVITKLTIQSDQQTYTAYLKKKKITISKKETTPTIEDKNLSKKIDAQLSAAESSGKYDATITEIMKQKLADYQKTLREMYAQTKNTQTRQLLDQTNNNINLLIGKST